MKLRQMELRFPVGRGEERKGAGARGRGIVLGWGIGGGRRLRGGGSCM